MVLTLSASLACAPESGDPSGKTPTATTPEPLPTGEIPLSDANNYAYTGDIDVPSFPTAAGVDIRFDWSGADSDLQCHDLDPVADIDNLAVLVLPNLDEAGVEQGLSDDTLQQADMGGYVAFAPGDATEAWLSAFTFFGTDTDIEALHELDTGSWLLLATTGTTLGVGARLLALFSAEASATATEVRIDPGCGMLSFEADLESLTPVPVLTAGPWLLDWTAVMLDGRGHAIEAQRIDELMVARFPGRSAAELEAGFLDLELDAEELWRLELTGGTTADLTSLSNEAGAFPGFAAEGPWLLALRCTLCSNPAPRFLTLLEPA